MNNILGKLKTWTWILGILILIAYCYVQWSLPHGPMINVGYDCVEYNDGRSSYCGDQFVEDVRGLDIPEWAKYLRTDSSTLVVIFIVLAIFFEMKLKDENDTWPHLKNK